MCVSESACMSVCAREREREGVYLSFVYVHSYKVCIHKCVYL